jgi:arginyl-tRNA synthetase
MNLYALFSERIHSALGQLKAAGVLPQDVPADGVTAEPPRDPSHGDVATNAAMVLSKPAGMPPRELAEKLVELLAKEEDVADVQIAGPGFINITLAASFWTRVLKAVLDEGGEFARSTVGNDQPVNVEYVSVNPTGPLHVGHCRVAVFGDALAELLKFAGFRVTTEYYINDAGAQVNALARSAYLRYREALGEDIGQISEGDYPGDYLKPVGAALAEKHGKDLVGAEESQWLPVVRDFAIAAMMDMIKDDLASLDIRQDIFFSERSLIEGETDRVAETIEELRGKELIYEGRLPPPKGKLPDDWEDREQTLFRATQFGDDMDRALIKSDGSYTYFASDIAYHNDKYKRGFTSLIDVWGADHGGYIKRMKAAVEAVSGGEAELDVKICQLVRLFRGGEPVKMSKRAGEFVTMREFVDEVGPDPVRFMMLYRKNDATLDFDFVKVAEQSRDNPVFYVQYAHARAYSVFRNTRDVFADLDPAKLKTAKLKFNLLNNDEELGVVKRISQFPRVVEAAALAHEPHRIAFYLYELAGDFHSLWNRGKELPQLRFINPTDRDLTEVRIALLAAIAEVLATGLKILGVQPIREMR